MNWENQKMKVVGWPEGIPFWEAEKQSKSRVKAILIK